MNIRTNNLVNKVIAIIVVMLLTMSDFLFVGASTVSYAINNAKTNSANVEFSTYFLNQAGEKVEKIEEDINKGDLYLYVDVTVKNEGYFNGSVTFNNNNFNVKPEVMSNDIAEISGNKVTLKQINAGTTTTIKLAVEAIKNNTINIQDLNRKTNVVLEGQYINSKNVEKSKKVDIKGNDSVEVNWVSNPNTANELTSRVLTNNVYTVNGEEKKVLQILINNKITNNNYPVKNTTIDLTVPENVKDVSVHSRTNSATNSGVQFSNKNYNYNKAKNTLTINVENVDKNNISWNKNIQDTFVVTYTFDKDTNIQNSDVTINSTISIYDNKELKATNNVHINENIDGIISYNVSSEEQAIYKGKLYTGEERNYNTTTEINVDYLDVADNISVKENTSSYMAQDISTKANIIYKESRINKNEFLKVFGEDGSIVIKDEKGTIVANINKDSGTDENGDIVISYYSDTYGVIFETTKPIALGTVKIRNIKTISNNNYSREIINMLTGIKENIAGNYNKKEDITSESKIELKNITSNAKLNVGTTTLSALETNKKVKITTVLENNDESKDLFKNPVLKITLPKQVTNVQAKCKLLYGNGLELGNAKIYKENENNIIEIDLAGEQTKYNTETIEGTTVIIYADLELDKLSTSGEEQIKLNYTNEIATSLSDNGEESVNVKIVANEGIITTNNVKEYGIQTIGDQGKKNVGLELAKEAKDATINISTINNDGATVKNVKILGSFPTKKEDNLNAKLTSGINVLSENKNVQVYYSNQENPTADLNASNNGWSKKGSALNSKSYLITVDEMAVGEKLEAEYKINIPENLVYNMGAKESYDVTYTNVNTNQEKTASASTLDLTTGAGPELAIDIKATVGNDVVGEGKVEKDSTGETITSGEIVKYEVTLKNNGNEDATNVELKEIIPAHTIAMELAKQDDGNGIGTPQVYLKELEDKEISKTIEKIAIGETKKVNLYIKADAQEEISEVVSNEITVKYKEREEKRYITNTIKNSNINLNFSDPESMEELEQGQETRLCLNVNNVTENDLKNVNVEFITNDAFEVTKIETFDDSKLDDESYEGDVLENTNRIEIKNMSKEMPIFVTVKAKNATTVKKGTIYAKVTENKNVVRSNAISINVKAMKLSINLEATNAGESVKPSQEIDYQINVANEKGAIDISDLIIEDYLDNCLEVNSVQLNGKELSTEEYSLQNSEENEGQILTIEGELKSGENANILIKTKVNDEVQSYEDTEIVNDAKISVLDTVVASTDKVVHLLGATVKDEPEGTKVTNNGGNKEDPSNTNGNQNNQNNNNNNNQKNPSNNNQSQEPNNNSNQGEEKTYTISGTAWLDANEDGKRDQEEEKLGDIDVKLVNLQTNSVTATEKTDEEGYYAFSKISEGKYLVVFGYDTEKYIPTVYQADGVQDSQNSDVEIINTVMEGTEQRVAATDTLEIANSSKSNIDLGLVEAKTFDLELSKTISKVTITNSEGTKTNEYDNVSLAKVEIAAKHLQNSTVVIEYKVKVKNNGELAGYVKNIVDYKPTDLTFNSSLNPEWYQEEGNLHTTSLANTKLEAGEEKELTLVLTKTMTESNTGLVNNTAEISEAYNNLGIDDVDSTPGNKQKSEDDMGSCNCIISVKTGVAITYITLTLSIIAVMAVGTYIISRKVLNKEIKF